MTVAIISGREGTGKTTQILEVAKAFPPVTWGVLELKDKKKLERERSDTFSVEVLYSTYSRNHRKAKQVNPIATLQKLVQWKEKIMQLDVLPQTMVIDGISNIRNYAKEAWLYKHNEETKGKLTDIQYKDWGAWGEVNAAVQSILKPLVDLALEEDTNLFLTAQMKENWVNDVMVGYTPDIKEYMSYPVPCLITLSHEGCAYTLVCEKEPENASWIVEDLEKGKGLLSALLSHDLMTVDTDVKKKLLAVQKTYMVRYTENGKHVRAYIEGTDREEVQITFEADNPAATEVSVTE